MDNVIRHDKRALEILSRQYPSIASASTEIINLRARLKLPCGTEHFITDVHGEYDQFLHILKNGSGSVKRKIEEEFGLSLTGEEKRSLAALIYYPWLRLEVVAEREKEMSEWYRVTIYRLIRVARRVSSKYTRIAVRNAIPEDFTYIIEELMLVKPEDLNQADYYDEIINSVISTGRANDLIVAVSGLIRCLVIAHLHVIGDIFDRGPYPHLIMDTLMNYHSVDIQWGNHDILWMGAAAGQPASVANVIRNTVRYGNLDILEDGYGINLLPLATLALKVYGDDECIPFKIDYQSDDVDARDALLDEKMHKAITVIQFKLEGQLIKENPWMNMEDRLLLDKINFAKRSVTVYGKEYALTDCDLPTVNPEDPYKLTEDEEETIKRLVKAFRNCERLQKHTRFLCSKGSLYKVFNGNLLYHGCVPMNGAGEFKNVNVFDKKYSGKELYDVLDMYARAPFYSIDEKQKERGRIMLWWLWENPSSPVFGKDKMTTFERYFIADKTTHEEPKNTYYSLLDDKDTALKILKEFGLENDDAFIVNGHVPVEVKKGESPVKCGGKLLIIDGGFSKAYQEKTGIAGYTLVHHSQSMFLAAHEPFTSVEEAVRSGSDIASHIEVVRHESERKLVRDTDEGRRMQKNIEELEALLEMYRQGEIKEYSHN